MPTRILREGIISSEKVNALSEKGELFYRKLMSVADDYGRFFSNPISILGACYPLRPSVCEADVKQMLNECITAGLVVIYGGGKYIVILNFGQQTRSKSKFPQPTDNDLLIKCEANVKQMSSLVGVEGGVEGGVVNGVKKDFVVSETMLRLGKLFNRRESTRWDSKELKALKEIEPIPDEDFQAVGSDSFRKVFMPTTNSSSVCNWQIVRAR